MRREPHAGRSTARGGGSRSVPVSQMAFEPCASARQPVDICAAESYWMDVSVVVPTRNRSTLLAMTLHSVLRQQGVDLEVIVVDEASTDDTPAVVASFRDPRIRVIHHDSPQGVSAARNRGMAEARAEWLAFLDDDDLWAPNKLTLQLQRARETGASWVYVGHVNINVHQRVTGGAPPLPPSALMEQLPQHNVVPGGCSGVIVSKRALRLAGPFDLRLQPLADWDLWLRLARTGVPACVSQPLVAYRLHGQQMSLAASRAEAEFRMLAGRNAEANPAIFYRYLGWWALRVKNHRGALRFFLRGGLQRRPEYRPSLVAADLASLGRDVFEHRLGINLPRLQRLAPMSEEYRSWRREGQVWVDALVNTQNIDSGSNQKVK
jgi:glycosyltransferase involved in cell wall biosynthesis